MTPEGRIRVKVDKALATLPNCYRFKPVQNGLGAPGLDYYCCVGGKFIAIETKAPGKDMTPRQNQTAKKITDAGGAVWLISSVEEAEELAEEIRIFIRNSF